MNQEMRNGLRAAVAPFEKPALLPALWQIVTSLGLYLATLALMYWSLSVSYWLTLGLGILASGFLVRTFIIQHDCGHGSFFASKKANDVLGRILGVVTLAPYANWARQHANHHSNWNNLDRRESGADIYSACLTVAEYKALSAKERLVYRLSRHPLIAHLVLPPLVFLLLYRVPFDTPKSWWRERRSVWFTNAGIAGIAVGLALVFGFGSVVMVHLPIVVFTTVSGVWLFSVQHRFENARWMRKDDWSFQAAAIEGSSYLKLPRALQWFTGNIGLHHIHHLSPRVPNYRLQACHESAPILQGLAPLTLKRAIAGGNLTLWDDEQGKLVRFRDVSGRG